MTSCQDGVIVPGMALRQAYTAYAAVLMLDVVPTHEADHPGARRIKVGETLNRELRAVLGGTRKRLGIDVVVAHARSGLQSLHAQPVEHCQHGGGLERGAAVAVQHRLGASASMPSASAVLCTSQPTILTLHRSRTSFNSGLDCLARPWKRPCTTSRCTANLRAFTRVACACPMRALS